MGWFPVPLCCILSIYTILSDNLLLFFFVVFALFRVFYDALVGGFVAVPLVFSLPADHTYYRIRNNRVYCWVWLRPDR